VKLKFDLQNIKTIYNPFDFSRTKISKDTATNVDYILFFGRFDEKVKNFNLMLEALCVEIVCARISIIPYGDGPDLNKIQDSIKGFQLTAM
jgi:glycosyltransferase involved in cell wall biosynthesis